MNKKIIQHKFEDFYLDISGKKYVYVNYTEDETSKIDNKINYERRNGLEESYVEIGIKFKSTLTDFQRDYINSISKNYYESLSNNLENLDMTVFNKTNHLKNNFYEFYHDKELSIITPGLKKYLNSTHLENISEIEAREEKGFVLNLNKKYYNNFIKYSQDSLFFDKDRIFSSEQVDADYTNSGYEYFTDDPSYNLNGTPIRSRSSHDDESFSNAICIGFLIEKFHENSRIAERFFLNESIFNINVGTETVTFERTIRDSFVKYGETYKYIIYPVFVSSITNKINYHLIDEYLFCYSPYMFNIICVEKENPNPPHRLKFNYRNENKTLGINWSMPDSSTNDTAGYFVFKRHSLKEPFELIGVVNFSNSLDVFNPKNNLNISNEINFDYDIHTLSFEYIKYDPNKITIFSIVTYDAHGNFSNYSEQLTLLYNNISKKLQIDLLSKSGAPLNCPNILIPRNINMFGYQESIEDIVPIIKNKKKISVYCTPEFVNISDVDGAKTNLLKENYVFRIFKLENQKSFQDIIRVKNFKTE